MHKCDNCGREFKGKSGLTNHSKVCFTKEEVEKYVNEDNPITEEEEKEIYQAVSLHNAIIDSTESAKEKSNEVVKTKKLSDNIERKIAKLLDSRKSTWDAEARHNIDLEIERLKNEG